MNIKNLLLATTAILLAACSTYSESPAPQAPGQIRVTTSVGAMTRVTTDGNESAFETGDRINVPANPRHYWRYRMHLTLEQLMAADGLNDKIRHMIDESGR